MEYKQLKDVADLLNGFAFKSKEYVANGIRIMRIANVQDGYIVDDAPCYYPLSAAEEIQRYMLGAGDLLVSLTGNVGRVGLLGAEMLPASLNQRVSCIRLKDESVNKKYLFYYLWRKSFVQDCIKASKGVAQLNLSTKWLEQYMIPVPSLAEQERIVSRIEELFSELDKAVETLQKTKQQLAVYRQAVLKDTFNITDNVRLLRAEQIGTVNLGRQRSPKNISKDYPTKYIRAANITENGLNLTDVLEMEFSPAEREKYYLKKDDIVVSEASGSPTQVGKPAIWDGPENQFCFQNTVIRHRLTTEYPRYVYWFYKYMYDSGLTSKLVGGVGINHLGAQKFRGIIIPCPAYEMQINIVAELEQKMSSCYYIEKTVDTALAQADAMRQSILKQAFKGRLI